MIHCCPQDAVLDSQKYSFIGLKLYVVEAFSNSPGDVHIPSINPDAQSLSLQQFVATNE